MAFTTNSWSHSFDPDLDLDLDPDHYEWPADNEQRKWYKQNHTRRI